MNIYDLFTYSVVISKSTYRLDLLKKSFTVAKLPLPSTVIYPETRKNGTVSCFNTHIKAVKYALDNNWPYILIFEDDAWPCKNAKDELEKIISTSLDYGDIKLASLGNFLISKYISRTAFIHDFWLKTHYAAGSHSYIMFKDVFSNYINCYGKCGKECTRYLDMLLSKQSKKFLKCSLHVLNEATQIFIQYTSPFEDSTLKRNPNENRHGYGINGKFRENTNLLQKFPLVDAVEKEFNEKYNLSNYKISTTIYADKIQI